MYNRPIPGQSLTATPRNSSYEQPPVIVDPKIAVQAHLKRLTKPKAMEDILLFIDAGVDIRTLVEGTLRGAVLEGIHSIDVSLIIAPVLHEHIKGFAEAAKLDYDEGFESEEGKKALSYKRDVARAKQMLKKLKEEESEAPTPEPMETPEPELEMQEQEPVKTGLMARM